MNVAEMKQSPRLSDPAGDRKPDAAVVESSIHRAFEIARQHEPQRQKVNRRRRSGPEGTQLQLWTAPIPAGGECSSVITSVRGASDLPSGKAFRASSGCDSDSPDGWPALSTGKGSEWVSPRTGKSYMTLSGWAGDADAVELRVAGQKPLMVPIQNHRYVTWIVNNQRPSELVAFKNGEQIATQAIQQ